VEADPRASSTDFGVPLLPEEAAELKRRSDETTTAAAIVRAYGATIPNAFAGVLVDQPHGGVVIALFTSDLARHAAAVRAQLSPAVPFEARQARWTLSALEAMHAQLVVDAPWFRSAGIMIGSIETDIPNNRVAVSIFSQDPAAERRIEDHFAARDMLSFTWDQNQLANLPRGSIHGVVTGQDGKPVAGLEVDARGDIEDYEPDGGVAYATSDDGTFVIPRLAAMGWLIRVLEATPGRDPRTVGVLHVVVRPNATEYVEIQVRL